MTCRDSILQGDELKYDQSSLKKTVVLISFHEDAMDQGGNL